MQSFDFKKIIDQKEILYLKDVYYDYTKNDFVKNTVSNEYFSRKHLIYERANSKIAEIFNKLNFSANQINQLNNKNDKLTLSTSYFQMYYPGAFNVLHKDNISKDGVTIVTLLDIADDIIGGDPFIFLEGKEVANNNSIDTGQRIYGFSFAYEDCNIPFSAPQTIGTSMIYLSDLEHGVSYLYQGYRLVLVTWFDCK